jgi:hypothetical protein
VRYRRDIACDIDVETRKNVIQHIVEHLYSVIDPGDDPASDLATQTPVTIEVVDHVDGDPNLMSIVGTVDADPVASYLSSDFDPDSDASDIAFCPYEEPDKNRLHDSSEFSRWKKADSQ